jgi:hypothetical protein
MLVSVQGVLSASPLSQDGAVDVSSCIPDPNAPPPLLFGGAKPSSLVLEDVQLLSQPPFTADARPLTIQTIPAGARVVVFDLDDQTRSYFRIIWFCGDFHFTGWVPVEAIRRSPSRVNEKHAPPSCGIPIATVDSLTETWESTVSGEIVVVVDLYRPQGGTRFPESFFYVTRNGRDVAQRERAFTSSGPFLINGEIVGTTVNPGNIVGFSIRSSQPLPDENLIMFGTIYSVPEGCDFEA